MPTFTTDLLELYSLLHCVLRDEAPTEPIDAICFFGQTQENDLAPLSAIAERWKRSPVPILVGTCDPIEDGDFVVRGDQAWKKQLEIFGVDPISVRTYPMSSKFPPSTDAEAWGMVEVLKENRGWERLVVTVPTLHSLRAFVSLVSACLKNGLNDVCIWSAPAEALPWNEVVCHSGGKAKMARRDHASVIELPKIMTYCAKGDHLTAREILDYMQKRPALDSALRSGDSFIHQ